MVDLPHDVSAPARARSALRQRFTGAMDAEQLELLELVTSELVTNAVVHGAEGVRFAVRVDGTRVVGEVIDGGGGFEHEVRQRGAEELGGRGLALVDELTTRWGVHEGTTHVWFELGVGESPEHGPNVGESRRPQALDD